MPQDTKYLKKRKNRDVWLFSKRIPKQLQYLYEGKEVYTKSLQTSCIKTARLRRNMLLAEMSIQEEQAIDGSRATFVSYYKTLTEAKNLYGYAPDGEHWNVELEDVLNTTLYPEIQMQAQKAVTSGIIPVRYSYTLRESLASWLSKNKHRNKDTIAKMTSTTERFLESVGEFDIPLLSIERPSVVEFIDKQAEKISASTISAHLSRLRTVYKHAWDMGQIKTKDNPFEDHSLAHLNVNREVIHHQLFSREQIKKISEWADSETTRGSSMGLLFRLGLFTGWRIGELCRLKVRDVYLEGSITAIKLTSGKTLAAQRSTPLTDSLAKEVLAKIKGKNPDDSLLGLIPDKAIRDFSRFKTQQITTDRAYSFHSLRVHTSTAYLRAGVPEERSAFLIGHKGGKTMTYGYYAKGDELAQMKEYVDQAEKIIIRDWLS